MAASLHFSFFAWFCLHFSSECPEQIHVHDSLGHTASEYAREAGFHLASLKSSSYPEIERSFSEIRTEQLEPVKAKIKGAACRGFSSMRQLEILFSRFDADGDGKLSQKEFHRGFRRTIRIPRDKVSDEELGSLFNLLDISSDGFIAVEELCSFVTEVLPPKERKKASGKAPRRLSEKQLALVKRRLAASTYVGSSIRQLQVLLSRYDKDNSGELDAEEFLRAVRKALKITADEISDHEVDGLFTLMDQDNIGYVSLEEIIDFLGNDLQLQALSTKSKSLRYLHEKKAANLKATFIKAFCTSSFESQHLFDLLTRFEPYGTRELNEEEFQKAMRKGLNIRESSMSDNEINAVFELIDEDGIGIISCERILAFVGVDVDPVTPGSVERQLQSWYDATGRWYYKPGELQRHFASFADEDGEVLLEELEAAFEMLKMPELTQKEISSFFTQLAEDGRCSIAQICDRITGGC